MPKQAQRWVLWGAIALLALLMLACIKIGRPEPVVTPVPPSPTPIPPTPTLIPPTPTPVPDARPEITSIRLCRGLTDDGRPFAETNTYSEIDPFAVSVEVANMVSRNVVSAHWYQGDAPIGLTEQDGLTGNTYVGMSLEPPGKWVPGDYRVEVSLDGDVQAAQDFAVIGMAEIPFPGGGGGGGSKASGESTQYTNSRLGFSSSLIRKKMRWPWSWRIQNRRVLRSKRLRRSLPFWPRTCLACSRAPPNPKMMAGMASFSPTAKGDRLPLARC
jgi:hypothetical protein